MLKLVCSRPNAMQSLSKVHKSSVKFSPPFLPMFIEKKHGIQEENDKCTSETLASDPSLL